jgi:cell division protein FtsL
VPQRRSHSVQTPAPRNGTQLDLPLGPPRAQEAKKPRKEITTFTIVMILVAASVLVVIYIGNVVAVDRLVSEIAVLERREAELKQQGENIRASINVLSSYMRIKRIATDSLHLQHSGQQPLTLNVPGLPAADREAAQ